MLDNQKKKKKKEKRNANKMNLSLSCLVTLKKKKRVKLLMQAPPTDVRCQLDEKHKVPCGQQQQHMYKKYIKIKKYIYKNAGGS